MVKVKPIIFGEQVLSPAKYSFTLDKEFLGTDKLIGNSTNEPKDVEVITNREYVLGNGWHSVSYL